MDEILELEEIKIAHQLVGRTIENTFFVVLLEREREKKNSMKDKNPSLSLSLLSVPYSHFIMNIIKKLYAKQAISTPSGQDSPQSKFRW